MFVSDEAKEPFVIAGIPDQNVSDLTRRYSGLTEYLSDELGVVVEYLPTTDYAATVTAFSRGDVQMAWFGGLTGVQARLAVPGSQAIAQRERDTKFHSVFVFNKNVDVLTLQDLKGLRFAFGSESSTSGHLMPRHFLSENGIDADSDFDGAPMFSGSHDQTWLLVQGGAADAGGRRAGCDPSGDRRPAELPRAARGGGRAGGAAAFLLVGGRSAADTFPPKTRASTAQPAYPSHDKVRPVRQERPQQAHVPEQKAEGAHGRGRGK